MSSELMKPTLVDMSARMPKFPDTARSPARQEVERNDRAQSGELLPRAEANQAGEKKVEEAVGNLHDFVQKLSRTLQFSIDEESGRTVIKVIESETKKVIRQIPPEEALALAQNLANGEVGLIREQA